MKSGLLIQFVMFFKLGGVCSLNQGRNGRLLQHFQIKQIGIEPMKFILE